VLLRFLERRRPLTVLPLRHNQVKGRGLRDPKEISSKALLVVAALPTDSQARRTTHLDQGASKAAVLLSQAMGVRRILIKIFLTLFSNEPDEFPRKTLLGSS
jgi:hypothetical protein